MGESVEALKKEILEKVEAFYEAVEQEKKPYEIGDRIHYGGRKYDAEEIVNLVDASLEFWLTTGRYSKQFETELAQFLNVKYCSLTNSGSSANLLAFMALTSYKLGERRIKRGDEVITVAASFPTTIAPILQYGAVPVFLDVTLPEYNIDAEQLEAARSSKTKAVMVAHTLGNPFNIEKVKQFCDKYNLWLIEDNCDALGAKYFYEGNWYYTGTLGDIGTSSFYPPHHITMGEGGAVYTNNSQLKQLVNSFRDWGRACFCDSGVDNTCKHRFNGQFGELPAGYDHKYVYDHLGYNLKVTDMQAAIGCAQLKKLPAFIEARKANWCYLREALEDLKKVFILPEKSKIADPSWFGFLLTVRETAPFTRNELVQFLEDNQIQTRMLFAGNLIKHPCFSESELNVQQTAYRVVGNLENTEYIMKQTFWIGVYPGITSVMRQYMVDKIHEFVRMHEGE